MKISEAVDLAMQIGAGLAALSTAVVTLARLAGWGDLPWVARVSAFGAWDVALMRKANGEDPAPPVTP